MQRLQTAARDCGWKGRNAAWLDWRADKITPRRELSAPVRDHLLMRSPGDFASRIKAAISALPREQRAEAVHAILSDMLKDLSVASILQMREEVRQQFDEDIPIIRSALDLIDGQLALREIAGAAHWR
jgi:hypothetical protein